MNRTGEDVDVARVSAYDWERSGAGGVMADVVYILIIIAFFLASVGYARVAPRL
jgi:hypothetical protein